MDDADEEKVFLICIAAAVIILKYAHDQQRTILQDPVHAGKAYANNCLYANPAVCKRRIRLSPPMFAHLCQVMRAKKLLRDYRTICVEEQVAMTLNILGQQNSNRDIQGVFQRSGSTISKFFNMVLNAICTLKEYIRKPPNEVQDKVLHDSQFYPYFENCLGAIGGTYIPALIPTEEQPKWRNKKGVICQNVLAAVDFSGRFTYVMPGWEGSASDTRVYDFASKHSSCPLKVPEGKYYLGDVCYPNSEYLLTPYPSISYPLQDFDGLEPFPPQSMEELFNIRHSSLRSVIDKAFRSLKKRWRILKEPLGYPIKTQVKIVIACCVLHNFLKKDGNDDEEFEDNEDEEMPDVEAVITDQDFEDLVYMDQDYDFLLEGSDIQDPAIVRGAVLRDNIAEDMFRNFTST